MNDVRYTECKFAIEIVPYMYGELSSSEGSAFETHLLDCTACTDEFAEISSARYEVYDWKKLAFDPLPTPAFEIPYEIELAPAAGVAWIDRVRAAFANGWAVPTMAFASIALFAGLTGLFLLRPADTDVAVNESSAPVVSPVAIDSPPLVERRGVSENVTAATGEDEVVVPTVRKGVSPVRKAEPKRVIRASRLVPPRTVETRATRTETPTEPRLNVFDEDEDTSLRLAQLFEDVDTRE